ncbi:protein bassoon-like isoform X2 [Colius striatus]|uniref:protein bassoon-like isoform X2 n=1 Tax=Colius striatus TaxID=57412 RepID=UPI002B1DC79D|nr:protein bassoon-like isoform X2 [Colius striatus]
MATRPWQPCPRPVAVLPVAISWCGSSLQPSLVPGLGGMAGFGGRGMLWHGWRRWDGIVPRCQGTGKAHSCLQRKHQPQRGWTETAKDGQRDEGEHQELPAPARMEVAKLPPSKRMAPAPPVPAKAKPAPTLVSRPGGAQPGASADAERGRAGDTEVDGFGAVPVTTAKLSHPTATRPRVPGQRPPSLSLGSTGGLCWGEQPPGLPCAGLCAPLPAARLPGVPLGPWPEETLALDDLKAEVRTLHILVDLMRVQHLRDLEDLRLELCQERAKRQELQVRPWGAAAPWLRVPTSPPALTAAPHRQRLSA